MKIFKAFFAVILACCLISAIPAMAAEVDVADNLTKAVIEPRVYDYPNRFEYNPGTTTDMTFEITKNNINHFTYTSGSFGTAGRIVVRFRNLDTGYVCNHNLFGNMVSGSDINCNITMGTYEITIIENEDSAGYFSLVFSSN